MQTLDPGETIVLEGRFQNTAEPPAPADPTTITLTITKPDGSVEVHTGAALTHPGTGHYERQFTPAAVGIYSAKWDGDGAVNTHETQWFIVGAQPRHGPCEPWASVGDVRRCGTCADSTKYNDALLVHMLDASSELLYWLSGSQYPGVCVREVRPCGQCSCHTPMSCGCHEGASISLGSNKVLGMLEVRVDGAVVPATAYRVLDRSRLMRMDGGTWPCCQDLTKDPLTDANTFRVKFAHGQSPPTLGVRAAADLACELAKGCVTGDCKVPEKVTNLVRQGVSMSFISPGELLDKSGKPRTGVRSADLFLLAKGGRRRTATVASPDLPPSTVRLG